MGVQFYFPFGVWENHIKWSWKRFPPAVSPSLQSSFLLPTPPSFPPHLPKPLPCLHLLYWDQYSFWDLQLGYNRSSVRKVNQMKNTPFPGQWTISRKAAAGLLPRCICREMKLVPQSSTLSKARYIRMVAKNTHTHLPSERTQLQEFKYSTECLVVMMLHTHVLLLTLHCWCGRL